MRQSTSVDSLFLGMSVIDRAVEAAKQEDRGASRVVRRPCSRLRAGLLQIEKMIDDDVIDVLLPCGSAWPIKENVVQPNGVEVGGDGSPCPCRQLSLPIPSGVSAIAAFILTRGSPP